MNLEAEYVAKATVKLGVLQRTGKTLEGEKLFTPIIGGVVEGPMINGKVCCGGADFGTQLTEDVVHVMAKYWIETDDGEIISVHNEGIFNEKDENARIKTTPVFKTRIGSKYEHLMVGCYVGEEEAVGNPVDTVVLTWYRLK